jgi:hypothetical protein
MSTYSVYNIHIDNNLSFTPGPTAGSVLAIDVNGNTSWVPESGSGSIIISPSSPNNIIDIWSGTQSQYDALSPTYSTTTIYFIE